jgi:anthranilate phosphoribosyltransferase
MPILSSLLQPVVEQHATLTRDQARAVLDEILSGSDPALDADIAALLTTMARRGETAAEITGFAEAMRAAATPLPLTEPERSQLVDTCGTGGDGLGTFNISTGAALVAAAAGARVAKHGNRAVTSKSGSADVLESLGIPIDLQPPDAVACLRSTGFIFLLAPALHPAMRRVAPIRRALGFRTIFNLAGPLTNPAGASSQVMGVWAESKLNVVAEAMALLGVRHAYVVHGDSGAGSAGLDELTVTGTSHLSIVRAGLPPTRLAFEPEQLGLARAPLAALGGGASAQESAAILLAIFRGDEQGPRREIVLLNAAAALLAAGIAPDWREALARAAEAVDSGAAFRVVESLRSFSRARTTP